MDNGRAVQSDRRRRGPLDFSRAAQRRGATNTGAYDSTAVTLDAGFDGRSCTFAPGSLVIHEMEVGDFGLFNKFAADFEVNCYWRVGTTFGSVRINSNIPWSRTLLPLPRLISNMSTERPSRSARWRG
jgi:hypothetical protein